jgi:hypothetical protein
MRKKRIFLIEKEIEDKMKQLLRERKQSDFVNQALATKLTKDEKELLAEKAMRQVLTEKAKQNQKKQKQAE